VKRPDEQVGPRHAPRFTAGGIGYAGLIQDAL